MSSIAMTIAGSDSGGGAGVQADIKTFSALGVYATSVITALTAQNTHEVRAIHNVPAEFVQTQIEAVVDDIRIDAVKIGMLSNAPVIRTVAQAIDTHQLLNIVVDPVMVSKSGARLLRDDAIEALRRELVPSATLITPNLPEACALLDESPIRSAVQMPAVAARLLELGPKWVLLKGGHLGGDESPDLLVCRQGQWWFQARRVATTNTHGTGCTLSSAIAAFLAIGYEVPSAVERAKHYLVAALETADQLGIGHGHGPVHHFHASWQSSAATEADDHVETA